MSYPKYSFWNRLKRKFTKKPKPKPTGRKISIGVVGAGNIAQWKHLPLLKQHPNFELTAIYDTNSDLAALISQKFQISTAPSLNAILNNDAVCICTPPSTHRSLIEQAAGKHILCEKPMAKNLSEAQEIISQRDSHIHMVNFSYRFQPAWFIIHQIVKEKTLGDIYQVFGTLSQGGWYDVANLPSQERNDAANWRLTDEGNVALELGSHFIDLSLWIFGPVNKVHIEKSHYDAASFSFDMANGASIQAVTSRLATGFKERNYLEIYGTKGSLRFDQGALYLWTRSEPKWQQLLLPNIAPDRYLDLFYQSIIQGSPVSDLPTFQDGLEVHKVLSQLHD